MTVPAPKQFDDFDAVAAAVMETERGRWFLAEFARRNRGADTASVLHALAELERRLPPPAQDANARYERMTATVARIGETLARVRAALEAPVKAERRVELALRHLAGAERLAAAASGRPIPKGAAPAPEAAAPSDPVDTTAEPPPSVAVLAPPPQKQAAHADGAMNGHAIELSRLAPASADSKAAAEPRAPTEPKAPADPKLVAVRPKAQMPVAVTPSLLDSLSEEDRAILFA